MASYLRLLLIAGVLWALPAWTTPALHAYRIAQGAGVARLDPQGTHQGRRTKLHRRLLPLAHGLVTRPPVRSVPGPDAAEDPDDTNDFSTVDALLDTGHRPTGAILDVDAVLHRLDGAWTYSSSHSHAAPAPALTAPTDPRGPPSSSLLLA